MNETPINIELDINELKQRLAQREAELRELHEKDPASHSQEIIKESREMVREKIDSHPMAQAPLANQAEEKSYEDSDIKATIDNLIHTVETKSLEEGIKEVWKNGNPRIIDAFHDAISDHLAQRLIESNKLTELKDVA